MKKISLLLVLVLLFSSLLSLASCQKSDVPQGMKLAQGGDEYGYRFYVPEEWTVSIVGDVATAFVSAINRTAVTYVEVPAPEGTVQDYFAASLAEFPSPPSIRVDGENAILGNCDTALRYEYDFAYDGDTYGVRQIFASFEGRFGIFTYTAKADAKEGETTNFDAYAAKADAVIESFRYLTKTGEGAAPIYEKDTDGWNLVSDKRVAKFALYLPEDMTVRYASGIVNAAFADGASITLSQTKAESMTFSQYWEKRKEELQNALRVTELTVISPDGGNNEYALAPLGNLQNGFAYEYTYLYRGAKYHVYQVFAASRFYGFVFTYTSKDENYEDHRAAVGQIMEKIVF